MAARLRVTPLDRECWARVQRPGRESRPHGDDRGAAGWVGRGRVGSCAPRPSPDPPPLAAGRSRRCPRRGSGARRSAATPRARGSRRPLPAYRAQLGPHGGAALHSLRRRRRRDRRAPSQPPGRVTEEEGRARARPSRGAGAGGRARGPAPPRPARFRPREEG